MDSRPLASPLGPMPPPPGCGLLVCRPSISPSLRSIVRLPFALAASMPILAVSWTVRPRLVSFLSFLASFRVHFFQGFEVVARRSAKPATLQKCSIKNQTFPTSFRLLLFKLYIQAFIHIYMYICIYAYTKQVGSFVTILQRIESIRIISYLCYAYRWICVNFSTDNAPTNKYYFLLIFFLVFNYLLFIILFSLRALLTLSFARIRLATHLRVLVSFTNKRCIVFYILHMYICLQMLHMHRVYT